MYQYYLMNCDNNLFIYSNQMLPYTFISMIKRYILVGNESMEKMLV